MQVRDFWQDVEAATNERQHSMFQCINRRLESLSRQIEATVGEALDVRLEPVTIAMDPPAAQDFHDSLQNLFAQGTIIVLKTSTAGVEGDLRNPAGTTSFWCHCSSSVALVSVCSHSDCLCCFVVCLSSHR